MEELNQIRTQLRNRLLICFGCVAVLGIAAALVVKHAFVFFFVLVLGCILSMLVVQKPRKRYRTAFKQAFVRKSLESVFTDLEYEPDQFQKALIFLENLLFFQNLDIQKLL